MGVPEGLWGVSWGTMRPQRRCKGIPGGYQGNIRRFQWAPGDSGGVKGASKFQEVSEGFKDTSGTLQRVSSNARGLQRPQGVFWGGLWAFEVGGYQEGKGAFQGGPERFQKNSKTSQGVRGGYPEAFKRVSGYTQRVSGGLSGALGGSGAFKMISEGSSESQKSFKGTKGVPGSLRSTRRSQERFKGDPTQLTIRDS